MGRLLSSITGFTWSGSKGQGLGDPLQSNGPLSQCSYPECEAWVHIPTTLASAVPNLESRMCLGTLSLMGKSAFCCLNRFRVWFFPRKTRYTAAEALDFLRARKMLSDDSDAEIAAGIRSVD